jgi:methylenetetrahydrofolate reductase (NADPH)
VQKYDFIFEKAIDIGVIGHFLINEIPHQRIILISLHPNYFETAMKITEILEAEKGKNLISFEILPPIKGKSIDAITKILDPLMEFKPPFIDVTYHREEYEYKQTSAGYFEKIAVRKRPGTVGICAAIKYRYNVEAVPHFLCGGFTREETENALIDLAFLGIDNILALRGDARMMEKKFVPEPNGHHYAVNLVTQINNMNLGRYLDNDLINPVKTNFCIGVAGYPEKHFEAANYEEDMQYLKAKIDAGGDYIVTQMFFNNEVYFKFVDDCRKAGINVPIIPGLKPITRLSQLNTIPAAFYIDMPDILVKELRKTKDDAQAKQIGVDWCIAQSKELLKYGVPCLHYYTMGDVKTTSAICRAVL